MQLNYFKEVEESLRKKLGDAHAKKVLNRAVYLFSIGGNDYFSLTNTNAVQTHRYVETVIGNLTSVLKVRIPSSPNFFVNNSSRKCLLIILVCKIKQDIYSLGGRKIAFQNVGPLGCAPIMKAMDPNLGNKCAEEASTLARIHNRYLAVALKKLESELSEFKYSIFDYYHSLEDRVNNPSK